MGIQKKIKVSIFTLLILIALYFSFRFFTYPLLPPGWDSYEIGEHVEEIEGAIDFREIKGFLSMVSENNDHRGYYSLFIYTDKNDKVLKLECKYTDWHFGFRNKTVFIKK